MPATTTRRIILAVVLTSATIQNLPLTARAADEKKTDEKTEKADERLLGTWSVASSSVDGEPLNVILQYTFTKSGLEMLDIDRQVQHKAWYSSDSKPRPRHLDMSYEHQGHRVYWKGIYRFTGEKLELAVFSDGKSRPSDFKWSPTNRINFLVLERLGKKTEK